MTFERPIFFALLVLLPLVWLLMRKSPGASRVCLALKSLVFIVIVIALADPWAAILTQRLAVTVVMDTSASMPRESVERGQAILRDLVKKKSGAELRLITFAQSARLLPVAADANKVSIPEALDSTGGMATDIAGSMQLALSTFPSQGARRIVLVSDGNETEGHALTEAIRARERGVEVFTVPTGGTARLPVQLESVASPQQVFSGERFTLSVGVESSKPFSARVWMTSQNQEIASTNADFKVGSNAVDLGAHMDDPGVDLVEVHVAASGIEQVLFSQAITVRRPRVLYVAGGEGPSQPLLDTLKRGEVDVDSQPMFPLDAKEMNWDAVVFDNYPDHALAADEQEAIDKYVFTGGGLIFIAGENNAQLAVDPHTPLEKLLPVSGDPPPPPEEPTALVLVLDKSRSMDGPKIAMVRQAARAALESLRPIDKIGVIAFDETPQWVVPLTTASDTQRISGLINTIAADGGTRIYPAVEMAFEAIRTEHVTRRHIILLTDGVSPPGNLPQLEKSAAAEHVTISTIGVGSDVDRSLLEELAKEARGKSYFLDDPTKIPQVISGETRDLQASTVEERPVKVVRVRPVEFIDGIDFAHAPHLLGFAKEKAKTGSETILKLDSGEPLLVRWQYGLGRVVAFMSDAKARWSADWVKWKSYGTLWPQMVRDVSHRDRTVRAGVRPGSRDGESVVYYDVMDDAEKGINPASGAPVSAQVASPVPSQIPPQVMVTAPGEAPHAVQLEETAPGHYEATVLDNQRGLYRIVSGSSELALPEAGFYRESEETKPREINAPLLTEISRVTGGRVEPTMAQLLDDKGSYVRERRPLWPYWLILALLLNFIEVAMRKGHFRRLTAWLQRRLELRRKPEPSLTGAAAAPPGSFKPVRA
jgi:Ca-activated chloride channel homolog